MTDEKAARAAELEAAIKRGDADAGKLDKILEFCTGMSDGMKSMSARLDALESAGGGKKTEDDEAARAAADAKARKDAMAAQPDEPVLDSDAYMNAMADAQERADSVAQCFGFAAPKPLAGETVRAYRLRTLRRVKDYSERWKGVKLEAITDPIAFANIEAEVYADAMKAARLPTGIPEGRLRMVTRKGPGGHIINEFYGHPDAWMNMFRKSAMVTKINGPEYFRNPQ